MAQMDGTFDLITEFAADGFAVQPEADGAAEGAFDIAAWIASIRAEVPAARAPRPAKPALALAVTGVEAARAARRARAIAAWDEDLAAETAVGQVRSSLRAAARAASNVIALPTAAPFAAIVADVPACGAGTRMEVAEGHAAIEDIAVGDLVMTRHNGLQPVTHVGRRTAPARGADAPVLVANGALGDHATLVLSQQAQVLLTDWRAELLFGADEVLVRARDLVNDSGTRLQSDGAAVTLFHIGFAAPQIIMAAGLALASAQIGCAGAPCPRAPLDGAEARVLAACNH